MNIPEEAVEAVAHANWEHAFHSEWDKQPAVMRDTYRETARRQVEAAAPFIAAQALRDEASRIWAAQYPRALTPGEIVMLLDDRADELDPQ